MAGITHGALYFPSGNKPLGTPFAVWPRDSSGEDLLASAASQALENDGGVKQSNLAYGTNQEQHCDIVACPLLSNGKTIAIVAVMMSTGSESRQETTLQFLQWGGLWLETLIRWQTTTQRETASYALTLMAAILKHSSSHTAAMEAANQLADYFGCERVSIGFRRGLPIRLQALSHLATFDQRSQLVRMIEAAMEEAVDQDTMIHVNTTDTESAITQAHRALKEQQGCSSVCSVPLRGHTGSIGGITFEYGADKTLDKDEMTSCEALARFIGPILELKIREDRPLWEKGSESLFQFAGGLLGSGHLKAKLIGLAALICVSLLAIIDGTYQITAPASIEGAVRQLLVAPLDGYVKQVKVRAGDLVKKGQLIASLDDRDLRLEYQKWKGEHNKFENEYQNALATGDRTALKIARAQIDQVDAELSLVTGKIQRTQLVAPFDGIVVSGDLSQSLGAPVKVGEILHEVAPLEGYKVVLEVDDHKVAELEAGKPGKLIIAALPHTPFDISVGQLTPIAISEQTRNYFRVEASLNESSALLRPGMRGFARVDIGRRKLLWIWTHEIIDRIRLWLWSVGL